MRISRSRISQGCQASAPADVCLRPSSPQSFPHPKHCCGYVHCSVFCCLSPRAGVAWTCSGLVTTLRMPDLGTPQMFRKVSWEYNSGASNRGWPRTERLFHERGNIPFPGFMPDSIRELGPLNCLARCSLFLVSVPRVSDGVFDLGGILQHAVALLLPPPQRTNQVVCLICIFTPCVKNNRILELG